MTGGFVDICRISMVNWYLIVDYPNKTLRSRRPIKYGIEMLIATTKQGDLDALYFQY